VTPRTSLKAETWSRAIAQEERVNVEIRERGRRERADVIIKMIGAFHLNAGRHATMSDGSRVMLSVPVCTELLAMGAIIRS